MKWLLSPINPADINTIQGKYPSRPPLPAVPGNEGVGEIIALGCNVQNLYVGDKVVPNGPNFGTWRTQANYNYKDVSKVCSSRLNHPVIYLVCCICHVCLVLQVPSHLNLVEASMLNVNPCTAYRMLKDFVPLMPGDTVIQNGGNSAVGQLVIQLCNLWNFKSVNIVRDRPNIQELKV